MGERLANTMTVFQEFDENFAKLIDDNDKLEAVAAALDDYGIQVTKSNYQYYANLM
jgi:hypothetical protein